jgi:hypothetical protein
VDDLARTVADLAARVDRLERRRPAPHPVTGDLDVVQRLADRLEPDDDGRPGESTVLYAGAGHWAGGVLVWQMGRAWSDLTGPDSVASAGLFSALAHPNRVRIVTELLRGRLTTAELGQRLDQPSSGQLFHHLKDLLAAGVVHQPMRGTYAVADHRVIPLLTLLSAALDAGSPADPGADHPEGATA